MPKRIRRWGVLLTESAVGSSAGFTLATGSGNNLPFGTDVRLGALADNGGATRTLALLAGSPAIDAASASGCPGKDQRDVVRPRGTACDMGSFER